MRAVHGIEAAHPAALGRYASTRGGDPLADAAYPSLNGVRVLIVDDQDDARMLVKTILGRCGAVVSAAASVSEALSHLEEAETDVVVSDIAMPDADGFALIVRRRSRRCRSSR